jgi:hypothetical protein
MTFWWLVSTDSAETAAIEAASTRNVWHFMSRVVTMKKVIKQLEEDILCVYKGNGWGTWGLQKAQATRVTTRRDKNGPSNCFNRAWHTQGTSQTYLRRLNPTVDFDNIRSGRISVE